MTDKRDNTSTGSRRKKFTDFNNWLRLSDLIRAMIVKKNVWDLIETGSKPASARIWEQKIKKNQMAVRTATQIIKEGVSDNIFNHIINITNSKEMWKKLRAECSKVG